MQKNHLIEIENSQLLLYFVLRIFQIAYTFHDELGKLKGYGFSQKGGPFCFLELLLSTCSISPNHRIF